MKCSTFSPFLFGLFSLHRNSVDGTLGRRLLFMLAALEQEVDLEVEVELALGLEYI